jgi:hypothetical protein
MRATLESTSKIVKLQIETEPGKGHATMPARIWEGTTESGIPFHAYIVRVAVDPKADNSQFERELQQTRAPSPTVAEIPLRLIL